MISDFKFLSNKVKGISFVQPRYPRFPTSQVPSIEEYDTPELRSIFLMGWRACEQGRDIFENPYSIREELIYSLYGAWEKGWLECYHNHPYRVSNVQQPTDDECYRNGWESAQRGYPLNNYPIYLNEFKRSIYQRGWDDFVNTH